MLGAASMWYQIVIVNQPRSYCRGSDASRKRYQTGVSSLAAKEFAFRVKAVGKAGGRTGWRRKRGCGGKGGGNAGTFGEPSQAHGTKRRIWARDSGLRPDSWGNCSNRKIFIRSASPINFAGKLSAELPALAAEPDWTLVKRHYRHYGDASKTAFKYAISIRELKARARREGWAS